MFMDCYNLTYIDISKATFRNVNKYNSVFKNCNKLTTIKICPEGYNNIIDLGILDSNYWYYSYLTHIANKDI